MTGRLRALWGRLTGKPLAPGAAGAAPRLEQVLVERFAAHFPGAAVKGPEVTLPFGGLTVNCELGDLGRLGGHHSASIFFHLSGGPFDNGAVFASVSGYGPTPLEAVVMGCCNWACAFGPVLHAGLTGEELDVPSFEAVADGQRFRVFLDHLDRAVTLDDSQASPQAIMSDSRRRLGRDGWMLKHVLASGTLPLLRSDRPVLLSAFCLDTQPPRTIEIKVNGGDWLPARAALQDLPSAAGTDVVLLRELAVAVPLSPPPAIDRAVLERTVAGLFEAPESSPRQSATWRGFRAHAGRLGPPLAAAELERLRREVPGVSEDYLAFLRDVGHTGAGPGYGLLSPLHPAQAHLAQRTLEPGPALALAHGGCGVMWLLAVEGARRGEVWVDASSSDGSVRRVDATFSGWYRRWLDAAVRDLVPGIDWDSEVCATTGVLSQVLDRLDRDGVPRDQQPQRLGQMKLAITLRSGGSESFDERDPLDPCGGCVALARRFGLSEESFAAGRPPLTGR